MARVKRTERADARRRYRAAQLEANRLAAANGTADGEEEEPAAEVEPRRGFRIPDVRADLAALPGMFLRRRLLWLPVGMLLAGFVAALAVDRGLVTDVTGLTIASLVVQLTLSPPAVAPIFLGGFLAPRASYLVGLVLGLLHAALLLVLVVNAVQGTEETVDLRTAATTAVLVAALSGPLIGAFAAWYRDFLRRSAQRRRADQEARARTQRREQRRDVRRDQRGTR